MGSEFAASRRARSMKGTLSGLRPPKRDRISASRTNAKRKRGFAGWHDFWMLARGGRDESGIML